MERYLVDPAENADKKQYDNLCMQFFVKQRLLIRKKRRIKKNPVQTGRFSHASAVSAYQQSSVSPMDMPPIS